MEHVDQGEEVEELTKMRTMHLRSNGNWQYQEQYQEQYHDNLKITLYSQYSELKDQD